MSDLIRNSSAPYTQDSFFDHFGSAQSSVCLFGKITPVDYWGGTAAAVGFASGTRDIYLPAHGITFRAAPGISPSVIESALGAGESANIESLLQFSHDAITEPDLEAGKWNFAELELWLMNYAALQMGEFVIFSGNLGEMKNYQTFFKAEAVGANAQLQNTFGSVTSRLCRCKKFGDLQCKKDLTGTNTDDFHITKTLTVAAAPANEYQFSLTRVEDIPDDFYTNGEAKCLTGLNAGISREIKVGLGNGTSLVNVTLKRKFPFAISAGDTFSMVAGCDRTLERCIYWENVVNRRAEDFIPGIENAMRVPPAA